MHAQTHKKTHTETHTNTHTHTLFTREQYRESRTKIRAQISISFNSSSHHAEDVLVAGYSVHIFISENIISNISTVILWDSQGFDPENHACTCHNPQIINSL